MIPFFAISLPANALAFFAFMFQIVAFEMIPIEFITDDMESALEHIKINPKATQFESIGFESVWVISTLGSLILVFVLFPIRFL